MFPGWLIFCIGTAWLRSKMYLCVEVLRELNSCNQYQLACNLQPQPIWTTVSRGMAMITQVVRFYYRFQKPSMIGLPWCFCCWQIALTRIFEAKYINAFPRARCWWPCMDDLWMFWKTHQELVANSPRWTKARELHRDWADLGLPKEHGTNQCQMVSI